MPGGQQLKKVFSSGRGGKSRARPRLVFLEQAFEYCVQNRPGTPLRHEIVHRTVRAKCTERSHGWCRYFEIIFKMAARRSSETSGHASISLVNSGWFLMIRARPSASRVPHSAPEVWNPRVVVAPVRLVRILPGDIATQGIAARNLGGMGKQPRPLGVVVYFIAGFSAFWGGLIQTA